MLAWIAWLLIWLEAWWLSRRAGALPTRRWRFRAAAPGSTRFARKPAWVVGWVVRMKAWDRHVSCRTLAERFNRQHAQRAMTISKSFVANVIARHAADIRMLRRQWRERQPEIGEPNHVWAMDLCFAGDNRRDSLSHRPGSRHSCNRQRIVLGIIDHGTRACIALTEIAEKSGAMIWQELLRGFQRFGIPQCIRVDNEACFHGLILRSALALLGVRVQVSDPGSPWQNGKIERLFGSFKRDLARIDEGNFAVVLAQWRWFYNFARPHQHLRNHTPAEIWHRWGRTEGNGQVVALWHGALKCVYFGPS